MRLAVVVLLLVSVALLTPTRASGHFAFDLGGGLFVPFDKDQRTDFGSAAAFTLGAAVGLHEERTWAFLDVGFVRDSGDQLPADPTFDTDKTKYRVVPITFGVRTDFVKPTTANRVAFYGGVGWQSLLTRVEAPFGDTESTPTYGLIVELRPEIRITSRWSAWVRQRIGIIGDVEYDITPREFSYAGSTLQAGLCWRSLLP